MNNKSEQYNHDVLRSKKPLNYINYNDKTSFQEFSKQYRYESKIMRNKAESLKQFVIRDIVQQNTKREPTMQDTHSQMNTQQDHTTQNNSKFVDKLKNIPNLNNFSCKNFDAQHLDKFLATNQTNANTQQSSYSHLNNNNNNNNNNENKSYNNFVRESISRNQKKRGRLWEGKENKQEFRSNLTDLNVLVTLSGEDNKDSLKYYQQTFESVDRKGKGDQLNFQDYSEEGGLDSYSRKQQMLEVKQKQQEYLDYKHKQGELQKKRRVHQAAYKSGILQVDNPYNQYTTYYTHKHQQVQHNHQLKHIHHLHRASLVNKYTRTHPHIEITNINHHPSNENINKLSCQWQNKKRIRQDFMNKYMESKTRLFSLGEDDKFKGLKRNNLQKHRISDIISQVQFTHQN